MLFQNNPLPNRVIAYAQDYEHGKCEPFHSHHCAQLIHTISGVIRLETHSGNWVIPPSRGMWIPAGIEHSLRMTGLVKVRTLFIDPFARADLPHECSVIDVSILLKALIIEALNLPQDIVAGGRDERIIELILDELRRLSSVSFYVPLPSSNELKSLCNHVSQRIAHAWTNADGAHILGVSERSVARKFQQEMSLTFSEWLRRKRLLLALEHLVSGKSVLDTALLIGYDSPSAFSAMFRSRVGISPTDYLLQSQ